MFKLRFSYLRIHLVGKTLWILENLFFYPKLLRLIRLNNLLPRNLNRELIVFDVGANLGQTISFYRKNFSNLKIFAFEPLPDCFNYLMHNFMNEASVFNFAISDSDGASPFFVSPFAETSTLKLPNYESKWFNKKNRILGLNNRNAYSMISVETQTIDSFLKINEIPIVDLLKIDVEGAELQVLDGCRFSFSEQKIKSIQIEVHHSDLREKMDVQINSVLQKAGFVRVASVRHAFGNFTDDLYILK
jgi:FkbM family methyltransferase